MSMDEDSEMFGELIEDAKSYGKNGRQSLKVGDDYDRPDLYRRGITFHLDHKGRVFINRKGTELGLDYDYHRRLWEKDNRQHVRLLSERVRPFKRAGGVFKVVIRGEEDLDIVASVNGRLKYLGKAERLPSDDDFKLVELDSSKITWEQLWEKK
jgi:hypothetical protein